MSSTIRLAIVGCGGITSAHLNGIRILQENGLADDVQITALCSRSETNARRYNERGNAPDPLPPIVDGKDDPLNIRDIFVTDLEPGSPASIYTDWREAVEAQDVDAVLILATVDVHHVIASAALNAGKPVFIEKPFTITVRAARQLCELADAKGLALGVAESLRFKRDTRATRWVIDEGAVGQLQMVAHASIGSGWSPDKIVGKTAWRHKKASTGSGILMDIGSHLFDRIRYLCGEPDTISGVVRTVEPVRTTRDAHGSVVETVEADVEDTAFSTIVFENGAIGSFSMSWAGRGKPSGLEGGTVMYGDLGCIKSGRIHFGNDTHVAIDERFGLGASTETMDIWFPSGIEDAFALELNDFFNAIRDGGQPETDGIEGMRDIAVCYGIIESSLRGEAVSFRDIVNCHIEDYQRPINDSMGIGS